MNSRIFALLDNDSAIVGIYSTLDLASQAMERVPNCAIEEHELDKLPPEPEGHREPDYGAPSAQERSERDYEEKQQRDRGYKDVGREYDKYEHEEFRS